MAKEFSKRCRDCDGTISMGGGLFQDIGNGICSRCRGTGRIPSVISGLAAPFIGCDTDVPCDACPGSNGQCRTCGGTGLVHYNEYSSEDHTNRDEQRESNYAEAPQYSYEDSYSPTRNVPIEPDGIGCSTVLGVVFILVLIIMVGNFIADKVGHSDQTVQNVPQQYAPSEQPVQPQAVPCESNYTGNLYFENKTSRTIYIFISREVWWKTIEVPPHQTKAEYDITADKYRYKYNYYRETNFDNNDVKGEIVVEKCKTRTVALTLPAYDWYTLTLDVWKEVNIPEGCCYAVVLPYKNFSIRFFEGDTEHFGNSYAFIPEGTTKIYLKSPYSDSVEVSIQKFTPWRTQ